MVLASSSLRKTKMSRMCIKSSRRIVNSRMQSRCRAQHTSERVLHEVPLACRILGLDLGLASEIKEHLYHLLPRRRRRWTPPEGERDGWMISSGDPRRCAPGGTSGETECDAAGGRAHLSVCLFLALKFFGGVTYFPCNIDISDERNPIHSEWSHLFSNTQF